MSVTTENPQHQRRRRRDPVRHPGRRQGPEPDRRVPVPRHQHVAERHPQPVEVLRLLRRDAGDGARARDRGRLRPPGRARRPGQRPDAGRVPAPRHRRLPHLGHRQHRLRARRQAEQRLLDRRGRHQPARHPRLSSDDSVRNGYEQIKVTFHIDGRRRRGDAARPGRAVHASALPCTTRSPTPRPSSSTWSAADPHPPAETEQDTTMSPSTTVDTVVIGAGHAGLAVSRLLTDAGHDHVVLERGRVGERWRTRALGLPPPADPELDDAAARLELRRDPTPTGTSQPDEFVDHLEGYADSFGAPVVGRDDGGAGPGLGSRRRSVRRRDGPGHLARRQHRDRDRTARHAVRARGPGPRRRCSPPASTATPAQLPDGGVLVVGASSSGVQIADELNRSGREVVLAVGRHTRMPRRYRGLDIYWWLEATGRLARTIDEMPDPRGCTTRTVAAARRAQRPGPGDARPRPGRPPVTRCAAGRPAARRRTAGRAEFGDDLRDEPGRRRGDHAPLPRPRRRLRRAGRPVRRGVAGDPARPGATCRTRRRGSTCGPSGIDDDPGRDRLPSPPPVAAAADHDPRRRHPPVPRQDRGARRLHRRAALPAPPRLGPDRRRPARRASWSSATCSAAPTVPLVQRGVVDERLRRRRRRRPDRRRLDGPAARPGRRPGRGRRARPRAAATPSPRTG